MPEIVDPSLASTPTFELKGSALTVMVLQLLASDAEETVAQLREKFGGGSNVLTNAPVLIDLSAVREAGAALDLQALVAALRELQLIPVGVRGGSEEQHSQAAANGLGLFAAARGERPAAAEAAAPAPEPAPPALPIGSEVITQPVRSGQRIVAKGDLIVLASVNSGAEILATGNIHIYGALRGRAFAGAQGDVNARVFCLQFNPDLVAIAGEYLVNDELDRAQINKTTLVSLRDERLVIQPIGVFDPHE